jgi:hypothetical protein
MKVNLKDLVQVKDAAPVTGYTVGSLHTYQRFCPDFPTPALKAGNALLYLKGDLAAWAKRRRANAKRNRRKAA